MPELAHELFTLGSYVTADGRRLEIVGGLPQEPSLRLVEDSRTLEVSVLSIDALRARGAQPVAR